MKVMLKLSVSESGGIFELVGLSIDLETNENFVCDYKS